MCAYLCAQNWAEALAGQNCELKYSGAGENVWVNPGFKDIGNCLDAVKQWYAEGKNYKYDSTPSTSNSLPDVRDFTQVRIRLRTVHTHRQ